MRTSLKKMCRFGLVLSVAAAVPSVSLANDMFDWAEMTKAVANAAKDFSTESDWKAAPNSSWPTAHQGALDQATARCPEIIASLPEDARPGVDIDIPKFCACYDNKLIELSLSAMFASYRMGEEGKSMAERREAWEALFDVPHEEQLGRCVVKTTEIQ